MNAPLKHPVVGVAQAPVAALVAAEGKVLSATDRIAIRHASLRAVHDLTGCGLAAWVSRRGDTARLVATSTNGRADRNTPFAQWLERSLKGQFGEAFGGELPGAEEHTPFAHALYHPFPDGSGGVICLSDTPLPPTTAPLLERLTRLAGLAHAAPKRAWRPRRLGLAVTVLGLAALCIPVRLSTLAPAEVVASAPFRISAPFDGVVEDVLVNPYAEVSKDTRLVTLEDTAFANAVEVSAREENLALARARRAERAAFSDPAAKAEVAVARAEAALAATRRSHAKTNLDRSRLAAPVGGIALFESAESLRGRPVATGETLIEIADPNSLELILHVPLDAGEALAAGAEVRLFLDADPSRGVAARVTRANLRAEARPEGGYAFETRAEITGESPALRLGARGVAKIYGERAPLGWWLARKPLGAARQIFGL